MPGFSEAVGLLKTVDISEPVLINNKNEDGDGKIQNMNWDSHAIEILHKEEHLHQILLLCSEQGQRDGREM
jgi:hypothetical protein